MAQFARPSSDISTGGWAPQVGATLFGEMDESSASDTDYIIGANGDTTAEVLLSSVTDPVSSVNHTLRVRGRVSGGGGGAERIDVDLYQGASLIANAFVNHQFSRTAFTTYTFTLSGAQADAITNYADLRIRFIVDALGASEQAWISWAELEVPDAAERQIFVTHI